MAVAFASDLEGERIRSFDVAGVAPPSEKSARQHYWIVDSESPRSLLLSSTSNTKNSGSTKLKLIGTTKGIVHIAFISSQHMLKLPDRQHVNYSRY